METMIKVAGLEKTFTLHMRDGLKIPVFAGVDLAVAKGECVVLAGPSGSGKSTLCAALRQLLPGGGGIWCGTMGLGRPGDRRPHRAGHGAVPWLCQQFRGDPTDRRPTGPSR